MEYSNIVKIKNISIAAACIFTLTIMGCKLRVGNHFLEKPVGENVTLDTIFSRATTAKEFLWHAYESLPYGLPTWPKTGKGSKPYDANALYGDVLACLTDIDYSTNNNGGHRYYYAGNYNAGLEAQAFLADHFKYNFYGGEWAGIRESYIFINNVDKIPGMSQATKDRLKAEARMIIAVQYTQLFRNYGGMFWIDHYYKPTKGAIHLPRLTAHATMDSIIALINRAIPYLPFSLSDPSVNAGRFTKAGAMGLKCRVLMFGASPLFNSNAPYMQGEAASKKLVWFGGYDPSLWKKTADACKALIDSVEQSGVYHLVNTGHPREDFLHGYYDRNSPELLISIRKAYTTNKLANNLIGQGHYNVTDNYVKMFPMADGTPINQTGSGYDPDHPYQNRDPRLYETVLINGDTYQNRTAELWIGGRERKTLDAQNARTGYRGRKFVLDIKEAQGHPAQWPYLRLSEIYLDYAEALDMIHNGPTAEAYKYVNLIRQRAGLDDLQNSMKDPSSKEEFLKRILTARVLELGFEHVRWFDMVRRKMKDVFTEPLYGMNIYKKGVSPQPYKDQGYGYHQSSQYIYARFKLPPRFWQLHFSPKWYLSAFPKTEIQKGYGLIQNPGW